MFIIMCIISMTGVDAQVRVGNNLINICSVSFWDLIKPLSVEQETIGPPTPSGETRSKLQSPPCAPKGHHWKVGTTPQKYLNYWLLWLSLAFPFLSYCGKYSVNEGLQGYSLAICCPFSLHSAVIVWVYIIMQNRTLLRICFGLNHSTV